MANANEVDNSAVHFTVAVFASGTNLYMVHLEGEHGDSAVAKSVACGYVFAGSMAVVAGVPKVSIELGQEETMAYAGPAFAGMLGEHLKAFHLAQGTTKART